MRRLTLQPYGQLRNPWWDVLHWLLILYHPRFSFDFVPSFWCELELKKHSCREMLRQQKHCSKRQFRQLWYDSRAAHQSRVSDISRKRSCVEESFRRSQNWSCSSSRILAVSRYVEKGFYTSAATSSVSSGIYCWNLISRDWGGLCL